MNKLTQKTSWEQYVTPEMKSIEIKTEGLLCTSPGFGIADLEKDNESLDF